LLKTELDNLVQCMVANAIEPLKKIKVLKAEVSSLHESQEFISNQNDDLTKNYCTRVHCCLANNKTGH